MIRIEDSTKCCGCGACAQRCPMQCISMLEDSVEGFLYPQVDESNCIDCGLCDKVCPVLLPYKQTVLEPDSYACVNNDENVRMQSSSGGLFTLFAEEILKEGGVVFGARFESDWTVVHDYTETVEGLVAFRGSKYVQSVIGDCFKKTEVFLKQGRKVLFSGTPCQVSGLNHFLQQKYNNLTAIDFVCHSVPSPKVWQIYLKEICHKPGGYDRSSIVKTPVIFGISFRDKSNGWKNYTLSILGKYNLVPNKNLVLVSETQKENSYMKGFLQNLFVRPSCAFCPARNYTSGSDIMIADFWGVDKYYPKLDDDKGISLALLITDNGTKLFQAIKNKMSTLKIPYSEVEDKALHSPITKSMPLHKNKEVFYQKLNKKELTLLITRSLRWEEFKSEKIRLVKSTVRTMVGKKMYILIKKLK